MVLGALQTIREHQPLIWVENEAYFDDPPNRSFIDMMQRELQYACTAVARRGELKLVDFHGQVHMITVYSYIIYILYTCIPSHLFIINHQKPKYVAHYKSHIPYYIFDTINFKHYIIYTTL